MSQDQIVPGTEVEARGLQWQFVNISDSGGSRVCTLRGLGGALLGQLVEVVLGMEPVLPLRRKIDATRAGRLREWLPYHQAFLLEQALGPQALLAAQPGRLKIEPYQLVPVVRALALSRVRLLLADGVGLGKTIQAGLIIAELVARRLAHRILVVSPAGPLLEQWRAEMRDRFGLRLSVVDRGKLDEVRRSVELGANPFDHLPLALASVDFLKQDRVLSELERSSYDIIIIDEAHHSVEAGSGATHDDSQRRRLAQVLARRCDSLLLLSATPHDGNDRSFASLCELLDPSLVDSRGVLRGARYQKHLIRRLKRHVLDRQTGKPLFPEREVLPCKVALSEAANPAFAKLTRKLLAFVVPEFKRAIRARQYSDVLSFFSLLKRSVSTVAACKSTLEAVSERLKQTLSGAAEDQQARRERIRTQRELRRRLERFGVTSPEDELELQEAELEDVVQRLADLEREQRRESREAGRTQSNIASLDELIALATTSLTSDPKIAELKRLVEAIRAEESTANVLVYTEYTTSQAVVASALKGAGFAVLTLSGEDSEKDRIEKTDRFRNEVNLIMVCTDAAAEGLNLHQRCHHLIHLELPFNPNRLEQRNGRIDRYGQTKTPIVRYLYLAGTFEGRILLRLIAKHERQRTILTFVPNTLGVVGSDDQNAGRLLRGLVDSEATLFKNDEEFSFTSGDPSEGADEATREALDEVERAFGKFEHAAKSNAWLAEAGANAEPETFKIASAAKSVGEEQAQVDLAAFVVDAVRLDGGDAYGNLSGDHFRVKLPPQWGLDLADTPGAEAGTRNIWLTTNKEIVLVQNGEKKQLVGYLGRAHPLVRFAIDRVRLRSLGATDHQSDYRAAAVKSNVSAPTLIRTFLARVRSDDGREIERVVAVRQPKGASSEFMPTPESWLSLANVDKAINPTGVWERHFVGWAACRQNEALDLAKQAFTSDIAGTLQHIREGIVKERDDLNQWLEERAAEFTPSTQDLQRDFLDTARPQRREIPADARGKLQYFSADAALSSRERNDAASVLKIYDERLARLNRRANLHPPEITEIGLLMVVPEDSHGT